MLIDVDGIGADHVGTGFIRAIFEIMYEPKYGLGEDDAQWHRRVEAFDNERYAGWILKEYKVEWNPDLTF